MVIKTTCKQLSIAIGLLIASYGAKAQMSGTFTVPGSFPSISAAVSALNFQGVNGPVTINVNAGYTETAVGTIILNATGTATNTITIQKSGVGANPKITAMPNGIQLTTSTAGIDGIFALNGSDYVTIDGIDLAENSANTTPTTCMEYGYGLFKASAIDGCQYNTIKNATITLNRINNNIAGNVMYAGCVGILLINAQIGAANTALTITSPSGSNSYNKIYANTIQNVNAGIYAIGFGNAPIPFTNADLGNDFGGNSSATGNQILNFGGATAASQPANGIQIGAQYNFNIAYNTINNNTGTGINHANTLRGIYVNGSGASVSGTIRNNTISLVNATGIASTMEIIRTSAITGGTINVLNNTLLNCTHNSTGIFYGIWNDGTEANVSIKNNTFTNVVSSVVTNTNYLISNTGLVTNALSIDNNSLSFNFTAATSTATLYWINAGTANLNYGSYSGNTINNFISNNTGTHYLFLINPAYYANATEKINNNALVGGYQRTGTTGTTYGIYHYPGGSTATDSISGNLLDGYKAINSTGTFYGVYDFSFSTAPYANKYIVNNSISNLRTNGLIYGFYNYYHNKSVVGYNTMLNDTVGSTAYCYYTSSTGTNELDIRNNTLKNFVQNSTTGLVYGLYQLGGTKIRVFNNNFDNITSYSTTNAGATIYGFYFSTSTYTEVFNNQVSNLKALTNGSSVNALYGMYFAGGADYKVFHNTIYLANTTSSGTNFGATGLYYANTITGMDLRNNIINVDIAPKGTGIVTALRASATPNNLLASSNANVLYTPAGANRFFYGEGLTTATALTNTYSLTNDPNFNNPCGSLFKTFMSPKMQKSFTENNLGLVAGFYVPSGLSYAEGLAVGTGATNVTTDITNSPRANPADAGAEEFSGTPNDKSGPSISFTPIADLNCTTSAATLTATITDASGVNTTTGTAPRLYYKKSTDANAFLANTTGTNGWKYVEPSNSASPFTFTVNTALLNSALVVGDVINYFVVAQDNASTPNVGASASFPSTFCGTTVALPSGAAPVTNFNSFNVSGTPAFSATDSPDPVCAGDSITLTALIGGPQSLPQGYGTSSATYTSDEEIFNVSLGASGSLLNNTSNCSTTAGPAGNGLPASVNQYYSNYTTVQTVPVPNLSAGATIPWSVTLAYCGTYAYSCGYSIYIDYNRNGLFTDPGEKVAGSTATAAYALTGTAVTGTFTVPANITPGLTLMRVIQIESTAAPAPTGTYGWGETEDYAVNLIGSTTAGSTIAWYNNAAPTTVIGTTNPLKIQANTTSTYNVTVTDPNGCVATASTLNMVLPLPTAPTATNSTQCGYGIPTASVASTAGTNGSGLYNWFSANTGGTLMQSGGPLSPLTTFYTNDFSSTVIGAGATLSGIASLTAVPGKLQITPNTTSQQGGITVNAGINAGRYKVDFDVTSVGAAGNAADGFSYSFGDDVDATATTPAQEKGSGTKLKIGFDSYGVMPDGQGIYLMYNNTLASITNVSPGVLAYSANNTWVGSANNHVTIDIDQNGLLTLTLNNVVLFNNIPLPSAYVSANKATWKHVIAGRTGGLSMQTLIDNLLIQTSTQLTGSTTYLSPINNTTTFYVSEVGTNGCNSVKVPVTATVTPPPSFTATSSQVGVCTGGSVTLSATSTTNPNYAYTWNPGALTGSPVTVSPTATTKYYVVGTTIGSGPYAGCNRLDSVTVQVVATPPPAGTTTPTAASICIGSGTPISLIYPSNPITLFYEDFETNPFGAVSGFATTGTFAWWRTGTYAYTNAYSTWMQPYNNANLWFTNTAAVNLNGTSNPTLTFSHICIMEQNADYGWVEYSTDNGTTWNNFPTSAYVGSAVLKNSTTSFDVSSYPDWIANSPNPTIAPTNMLWKNETIKLDAYTNATQFKVRFRISSDNNNTNYYGWVVDNVRIFSQYNPVWTPLTGLYKNAGLTLPLTAADTLSTVFASPTVTTSYTTQTSNAGCLSVASTPPTVITVNTYPTNPVIVGNSPLCTGNTFIANLTHNAVANPTYAWSGPGPYSATTQNANVSNLTMANNGTYKVVINNNGCKDSATVNLVVNQTPKIDSITKIDPAVCATLTGSMTLYGLLPSTTYTLSYTKTGTPVAPANITTNGSGQYTIANLGNGVYTAITVTRAFTGVSCPFTYPSDVTLLDPNPPSAPVISANNPVCFNQPLNINCSITAIAPYQINWSGPNGFSSTNLNNLIANAQFANAGTYSVTVTKNNCVSAISTVNIVVNALPPAPFIGSNSPVCTGAILNLNSTTNQTGTSYTWTGPNGFTSSSSSPIINNVSFSNQGTYSAYAYLNGCQSASSSSLTVTVKQTPNAPVASSNTPVCANGALQLFATNLPGTTYVWSGPTSYASTIQNPIITNASVYGSGTYTVNAILQGCYSAPATTNVVVLPTPPNPTVSNLNVCQGSGPQSLTAVGVNLKWYTTLVGGIGNVTAPVINPTIVGTSTYYVTQTINGCESNRQALVVTVLAQPNQPSVANTNIKYCQFEVPQTLTAIGNNILWYTINPAQGGVGSSTPPTINTLLPGVKTYWVTQSGANGCPSVPLAITVTVNTKPAPPLVTTPIRYCRDEVSAPIAATGQNLKWYVSATGGIPSIIVPIPNTSAPNTYTYYVTQTVNGCESDREQVVVNIIDRPNGFIAISPLDTTTKVICPGDQLTMNYFGNAGTTATYIWSVMPGDQIISGSGQGPVVVQFNVTDSNRRVFLTINQNGCSSIMESHIIIVKEVPVLDIIAKADVCLNDLVQVSLNNTTHARIDLYNWDFDGANVIYGNNQAGPMGVVWNTPGTKVVQLTGVLDNCVTKPDTMLVTVHDLPIANIQGATGVDICANDTITLVADDAPNLNYTWTPAGFFYNGNTTATVSANVTFTGYIHLTTKDNWGCINKDSVYVNAKSCCDIFIPNAFSPNNDGKNDIFRIVSQPNQDIHQFRIVNRWGQTVFQTVSMYIGWDGSFNGKAQDPGTYFYYVKYTCSDGTIKEKSGDFMLVR
jgi:gliding motility-associated-like protein